MKTDEQLKLINEFIMVDIDGNFQVKIACYFTNVDGKGELETEKYQANKKMQ